ncbi:MAG: sigma-70 family RNA polymerase sigma factor [Phycisphaerae bacterium]|nr:sigma-70 family RNA polymerase sigma factor [Phycisphaerae bacterium]
MEPHERREAIAAAKAGRADGYEALLAAYGQRIYGYFLRATGDVHDAEDLLSEWTLRLVRTLGRYDERGRLEPWLFRIAANLVRDRIRRRRVRPGAVSLTAADDGDGAPVDRLAANTAPVDADLEAAEAGDALQAAMETLDATTRQMILLRHYGQMSFREIAELYDCPLGTALARVHRGLKALRRVMDKRDERG